VAIENIRILKEEKLVDRVKTETGPYLNKRLQEFLDHPLVGEVRGVGLLAAIELVPEKPKRSFFPRDAEIGTHCRNYCFKSGLVMRAIRDTMVLSPPFIVTEKEVDEIVAKAKDAIDQTARDFGKM
jgi:putrescine aminotransferase